MKLSLENVEPKPAGLSLAPDLVLPHPEVRVAPFVGEIVESFPLFVAERHVLALRSLLQPCTPIGKRGEGAKTKESIEPPPSAEVARLASCS